MEGSLGGTVLAPTNSALSAMPDSAAILADHDASAALVNSHVVSGELDTVAIFSMTSLSTRDGDTLAIDAEAHTITGPSTTPASIVSPDHHGTDGYVHVIDAVLDVPAAPAAPTTPPTEPPPSSTTSATTLP